MILRCRPFGDTARETGTSDCDAGYTIKGAASKADTPIAFRTGMDLRMPYSGYSRFGSWCRDHYRLPNLDVLEW